MAAISGEPASARAICGSGRRRTDAFSELRNEVFSEPAPCRRPLLL
jgi:hypothetical protein